MSNTTILQRIIFALVTIAMAITTAHADEGKWYWPVSRGRITSGIGWRVDPINHKRSWHNGIDIAVPSGTPVQAAGDGVIYFSGLWKGYGNLVVINHGLGGFFSMYGHNSRLLAAVGTRVKAGDVIALSGSTGHSTGPHIHFETRVWKDGPKLEDSDEAMNEPPAEVALKIPANLYAGQAQALVAHQENE